MDMPIIYAYTRAQAIEDGVLVDVTETTAAWRAGIKMPIALTATVYGACVEIVPEHEDAGEAVNDALHTLLFEFANTIRKEKRKGNRLGNTLFFTVPVARRGEEPKIVQLKSVVGPGDDRKPVLTIMYPHED